MRIISDDAIGIVTVYQEAEGEPFEGKVAVAEVVLRRTRRKFMSDGTVAGTALRKYQFSGMNTDSRNRVRSFCVDDDDPAVRECVRAWEMAKAGSNYSAGALHYYNPTLCGPVWAHGAQVVARVGNHNFVILKEVTR